MRNEQWTKKAISQYLSILIYLKQEFGLKTARKFTLDIEKWRKWIIENPEISALEPLLSGMKHPYRSRVVSNHSKVVYYFTETTVYFVAVWDMRRNPDALRKALK